MHALRPLSAALLVPFAAAQTPQFDWEVGDPIPVPGLTSSDVVGRACAGDFTGNDVPDAAFRIAGRVFLAHDPAVWGALHDTGLWANDLDALPRAGSDPSDWIVYVNASGLHQLHWVPTSTSTELLLEDVQPSCTYSWANAVHVRGYTRGSTQHVVGVTSDLRHVNVWTKSGSTVTQSQTTLGDDVVDIAFVRWDTDNDEELAVLTTDELRVHDLDGTLLDAFAHSDADGARIAAVGTSAVKERVAWTRSIVDEDPPYVNGAELVLVKQGGLGTQTFQWSTDLVDPVTGQTPLGAPVTLTPISAFAYDELAPWSSESPEVDADLLVTDATDLRPLIFRSRAQNEGATWFSGSDFERLRSDDDMLEGVPASPAAMPAVSDFDLDGAQDLLLVDPSSGAMQIVFARPSTGYAKLTLCDLLGDGVFVDARLIEPDSSGTEWARLHLLLSKEGLAPALASYNALRVSVWREDATGSAPSVVAVSSSLFRLGTGNGYLAPQFIENVPYYAPDVPLDLPPGVAGMSTDEEDVAYWIEVRALKYDGDPFLATPGSLEGAGPAWVVFAASKCTMHWARRTGQTGFLELHAPGVSNPACGDDPDEPECEDPNPLQLAPTGGMTPSRTARISLGSRRQIAPGGSASNQVPAQAAPTQRTACEPWPTED